MRHWRVDIPNILVRGRGPLGKEDSLEEPAAGNAIGAQMRALRTCRSNTLVTFLDWRWAAPEARQVAADVPWRRAEFTTQVQFTVPATEYLLDAAPAAKVLRVRALHLDKGFGGGSWHRVIVEEPSQEKRYSDLGGLLRLPCRGGGVKTVMEYLYCFNATADGILTVSIALCQHMHAWACMCTCTLLHCGAVVPCKVSFSYCLLCSCALKKSCPN